MENEMEQVLDAVGRLAIAAFCNAHVGQKQFAINKALRESGLLRLLELIYGLTLIHTDGPKFDKLFPEYRKVGDNQKIRWEMEDRIRTALAAMKEQVHA